MHGCYRSQDNLQQIARARESFIESSFRPSSPNILIMGDSICGRPIVPDKLNLMPIKF